jgi:hypothetical protein
LTEFERVAPWLEAALEYSGGTHSIEDVKAAIDAGKLLLITHPQCAMVFEIIIYPRMKVLHGFLCGGDLEAIKGFDPTLVNIARDLGCKRISIAGRHGWGRALKDLGYSHTFSVVSKDVQ